jgi:protein TonB
VGLNLESTVEGGSGGSFAVGNTRMGSTEDVAQDPDAAKPLPKGEPAQRGQNQSATRIPAATGGGEGVTRPKPLSRPKPDYPPLYESQGLEADVVVKITLNEDGEVVRAEIVTPSKYEKFNENALANARETRFTPATKDGKPIPWTLTYTVRFRIPE